MRTNVDLAMLVPPGFTLSDVGGDANRRELARRPTPDSAVARIAGLHWKAFTSDMSES